MIMMMSFDDIVDVTDESYMRPWELRQTEIPLYHQCAGPGSGRVGPGAELYPLRHRNE